MATKKKPSTTIVETKDVVEKEVEVIASFYDLQNNETLRKVGDKFTASEERIKQLKSLNLIK